MRVSLRVLARLDPAQYLPNQLVTRPIVVMADDFVGSGAARVVRLSQNQHHLGVFMGVSLDFEC